ncbi:MAG: DMT family transporter [Pseudomonadota bacterium]
MFVVVNYLATVLIWGSTWYVILFQLDAAAIEVSVALRFFIAAAVLLLWGLIARRRLSVGREHAPWIALQGTLLFCVNYMLVYFGTHYVTTGLVAVLFAMLIPFNILHERIFFGVRLSGGLLLAAALGIAGIVLVFWPELEATTYDRPLLLGAAAVLAGAYSASLGNMAAIRNTRRRLPVFAINAYGMLAGATMSLLFAWLMGRSFVIEWSQPYVWSLLYLAVPGSAIAFGSYLVLIDRIGSGRAAYANVLLPIVALIVSTVFEGYRWTPLAALGVALALTGNFLILAGKLGNNASPTAKRADSG